MRITLTIDSFKDYIFLRFVMLALALSLLNGNLYAQQVDLSEFNSAGEAKVTIEKEVLNLEWPIDKNEKALFSLDLQKGNPLIKSIILSEGHNTYEILSRADPLFLLTLGKRDLSKASGWNIFFDRTAYGPHKTYRVNLEKKNAKVISDGSRTRVAIPGMQAAHFSGQLEITVYHGSPLVNIAAVMSTEKDSTAIIYDAGFVNNDDVWKEIFWSDPDGLIQSESTLSGISKNLAVKYRTVIGESEAGSIAVFPPPHQYFYPLDNAYNLKYVWHGENYRNLVPEYGLGIRHELLGDRRHVPWFNAPPGTFQRLNFFCLLSKEKDGQVALEKVKAYTHGDSYKPLPGYKTMASHFHTEHIDDILTHKPLPDIPGHVKVMKQMGVNIMHQGEFHLAGNPRDPGPRRLPELQAMFEEFRRLSGGNFIMLPGEEPNVCFGGHWMNAFPKPVYWIMSRRPGQPFVEEIPKYGKVYRVGSPDDMVRLLEVESGLAWTAHARTKGSTGFPDHYKDEEFFKNDRFLGAAWKSLPADLSRPKLGTRILDLMNDMANWGHQKYVIGEADLFKLEPGYEVYGPMNINYLKLDKLPNFDDGWSSILQAMRQGKFFVTTGEVLLPEFTVNGKSSGEQLTLTNDGAVEIQLKVDWTFPLSFVEVVSGDGEQVYRQRIELNQTKSFGEETFQFNTQLSGRKWVRVEVWDVAVNGAFTEFVWLNE